MITPKEIDAIRKRVEGATPGPWEHTNNYTVHARDGLICAGTHYPESEDEYDRDERNHSFIANARTDIPKLLDEVDRLNKRVRFWRDRAIKHRALRRAVQAEIEEAAVYVQAGIDNDPDFPKDPRWKGVRTWIETRGEPVERVHTGNERNPNDDRRTL